MDRNRTFTILLVLLLATLSAANAPFSQQRKSIAPSSTQRAVTIQTEPNAMVWLDEIRRGTTDATGKLTLEKVSRRAHTLRVRASGFKEVTMLLRARRGEINIRLVLTTDEAELTFQQAEAVREQAKDDESRQKAAELYRQAMKLRPAFPAAHVGLARVLMDSTNFESALAEIEKARHYRRVYPEASAVEGRIYREEALTDQAFGSFNRALRESHGFQPEARVGLARIYEDKGWYEQAAREYQIALDQLSDTEPIIYQLLGAVYEKLEQYKDAVQAYEKYLELAPNGPLAPAIRSVIDQLKRQAGA